MATVWIAGWMFSLAGCQFSEEVPGLQWLQSVLETAPAPSPSPPSPVEQEFVSVQARNAKANAEILKEMLQVVFNQEPKDRVEFGSWVDVLNQGASFEGVYNGLTHSDDYRKQEGSGPIATVEALREFSEQLAMIEVELPKPTEFSTEQSDASVSNSDSGEKVPPAKEVLPIEQSRKDAEANRGSVDPKRVQTLRDQYAKQFVGVSIFVLKRVLSDEIQKLVNLKLPQRPLLASWFSKWVMQTNQKNLDFGVSLRNKKDFDFHYRWAMQAPEDRLKWEVLNRIHRVLNEANRQKQ
jgi:hypothetical protein